MATSVGRRDPASTCAKASYAPADGAIRVECDHRAQILAPGSHFWHRAAPCGFAGTPPRRSKSAPGLCIPLSLDPPSQPTSVPPWKSSTTTTSCSCRASAASRAAASATPRIEFGPHRFKLPVVPANMKHGGRRAHHRDGWPRNGYFYVMHRFDLDTLAYAKQHARPRACWCRSALGVKPADYQVIDHLAARGCGRRLHHHRHRARPCRERAQDDRATSRQKLPKAFVIAGNVGHARRR